MPGQPPAPERPVVVDTTPIIALAMVDQLGLLPRLFGEIVLPSAVRRELVAGGHDAPGATAIEDAGWLHTVALSDPLRADLLSDLDRGEAEVIALALEREARLVIIDERLARRHAGRLGLTLTGTLGVLLLAKERGLLHGIAPLVSQLQTRGIHLGRSVIERTLELADEADGISK